MSHDAHIERKDRFGNTPIDEAKQNGYENIAAYLAGHLDDDIANLTS